MADNGQTNRGGEGGKWRESFPKPEPNLKKRDVRAAQPKPEKEGEHHHVRYGKRAILMRDLWPGPNNKTT